MHNVELRKVEVNDLEALQKISQETFAETFSGENTPENMEKYLTESFSKEKLSAEMAEPHSSFYFAELHNDIIGYLKLNVEDAAADRKEVKSLEIERIYVRRGFHGKKVGNALLEKAIEEARAISASYLWLGVWEHNLRAIHCYRKYGFEIAGSKLFRLGEDEQTDFIMKLHLQYEHC